MKSYTFRLTDEEQQIIDVVSKNNKYRHFKDPKVVYMNAAMDVLKKLARWIVLLKRFHIVIYKFE